MKNTDITSDVDQYFSDAIRTLAYCQFAMESMEGDIEAKERPSTMSVHVREQLKEITEAGRKLRDQWREVRSEIEAANRDYRSKIEVGNYGCEDLNVKSLPHVINFTVDALLLVVSWEDFYSRDDRNDPKAQQARLRLLDQLSAFSLEQLDRIISGVEAERGRTVED